MSASGVAAATEARSSVPGLRALAEARRHLGLKEDPPGSNQTPFGRWFGADGEPWCAIFLSYCFKVGAGVVLCAGDGGAGCNALGCAYVPTLEAWLRETGQWLEPGAAAKPGDIVVFNWDGGDPDHAGLVAAGSPGGSFRTIEGNCDDEVAQRTRSRTDVEGFGRITISASGAGVLERYT
jgi:CHAP domain